MRAKSLTVIEEQRDLFGKYPRFKMVTTITTDMKNICTVNMGETFPYACLYQRHEQQIYKETISKLLVIKKHSAETPKQLSSTSLMYFVHHRLRLNQS